MSTLIDIRSVSKSFPVRKGIFQQVAGHVHAVADVSATIEKGETVGLVGESGCGKSTLAKMLVGLNEVGEGEIRFEDKLLDPETSARNIQIVFQDPYSSLDPRLPVGESIAEGLAIHGMGDKASRRQKVADMLETVGLPPQAADRYPHEFSGGQRQRIGIARALIMDPRFVVCDEPTSALDVSVQAQILNLLRRLQQDLGLTLLFISHNLSVVQHVADRVMVMYLGRIVESAPNEAIFSDPRHPYTKALLSATPVADPDRRGKRVVLEGELPSPINPPSGCPFHPRCWLANDRCKSELPRLLKHGDAEVACHAVEEGRDRT